MTPSENIKKYLDYIVKCSPKELYKLSTKVKSNTYTQAVYAAMERDKMIKDEKMMSEFLV